MLPAFADLPKASRDVLHGTASGEGVFQTAFKFNAESVNADGVIFALSATQSPGSVPATSLTTIWSPRKDATFNAAVTGAGTLSVGATILDIFGVEGLRASLLTVPPSLLASGQVTLDYTGFAPAHVRAVLTPSTSSKAWAAPLMDLSATSAVGSFLVGAQAAVDTSTKTASRWSLASSWIMSATKQVRNNCNEYAAH
jgi:hypothetical protein